MVAAKRRDFYDSFLIVSQAAGLAMVIASLAALLGQIGKMLRAENLLPRPKDPGPRVEHQLVARNLRSERCS